MTGALAGQTHTVSTFAGGGPLNNVPATLQCGVTQINLQVPANAPQGPYAIGLEAQRAETPRPVAPRQSW